METSLLMSLKRLLRSKKMLLLYIGVFVMGLFLVNVGFAQAAICHNAATGNWSTVGIWSCGHMPTSADDVTLTGNGQVITVDVANAAANTVTINAPGSGNRTNALSVGANTLTITGTLAIQGAASNKDGVLQISTGTVTVGGDITTNHANAQLTFSGAGILNAGGTFMSGTVGTFTASTGTINFNEAGSQTIAPFAYAFNNVTLSGSGAKTISANATISGNLSIAPTGSATASIGTGLNISVGTLTLGGVGTASGTWGSTSSSATNKNNTYFSATTGIVTVTTGTKSNQATLILTGQTVGYPTAFAALSTTGGSGTGAVTYAVTTAGTAGCSIVGTILSYTSAGTCGVTATKAADSNYNAISSAEATFTINKGTQATLTTTASRNTARPPPCTAPRWSISR